VNETGPSEDQMLENGGRGAATMLMQILGGNRRIRAGNHNEKPCVVVLAGNNQTGSCGMVTARHLVNHECHVIALVIGSSLELVHVSPFIVPIALYCSINY
jgi:NAD(P)H-hydrate repair Nnr-like enzyme with NAD(P)H-hydrate epimerase domain